MNKQEKMVKMMRTCLCANHYKPALSKYLSVYYGWHTHRDEYGDEKDYEMIEVEDMDSEFGHMYFQLSDLDLYGADYTIKDLVEFLRKNGAEIDDWS